METFDFSFLNRALVYPVVLGAITQFRDEYFPANPSESAPDNDQVEIKCFFTLGDPDYVHLQSFLIRHGDQTAFLWKKPGENTSEKWLINNWRYSLTGTYDKEDLQHIYEYTIILEKAYGRIYVPEWKRIPYKPGKKWKPRGLLIMHWDFYNPPSSTFARTAQEGFSHGAMEYEQVKAADEVGLLSIVKDFATKAVLENPKSIARFKQRIDKIKTIPGLDGYLLSDEPLVPSFASLREVCDILEEKDPSRLRYINLNPIGAPPAEYGLKPTQIPKVDVPLYPKHLSNMPSWIVEMTYSYLEYLRQFVEIVRPQLLCYDQYYLRKGNVNHGWFLNLELVRIVGKQYDIPFMVIFQAGSDTDNWETVTRSGLRHQFFSVLAYGGIGGSYYTYWGAKKYRSLYQDGVRTKLVDSVEELNFELLRMKWYLAAIHVVTYHTNPLPIGTIPLPKGQIVDVIGEAKLCIGIFDNVDGKKGFILSDRDCLGDPRRVQIKTMGKKLYKWARNGGWEIVKKDANGIATILMAAGDGIFFKIE
jgi:phage-related protein